MNTFGNNPESRQAAINGLAVAGFVALVVAGMWLAVYSTRFVPTVIGRIGTAAVYIGSVFKPASTTPSLVVVPSDTASSTLSFGNEASSTLSTSASTSTVATSTPVVTLPEAPAKPVVVPTAGKQSTTTVAIPAGLPDLIVKITAVGYMTSTDTSTFVASSTAPKGTRPAVSFTIKNIGAGVTGPWNFKMSLPTTVDGGIYQTPDQTYTDKDGNVVPLSLRLGESVDYIIGFDQAITGPNQEISITADPDNKIAETNKKNDTASTTLTILGN